MGKLALEWTACSAGRAWLKVGVGCAALPAKEVWGKFWEFEMLLGVLTALLAHSSLQKWNFNALDILTMGTPYPCDGSFLRERRSHACPLEMIIGSGGSTRVAWGGWSHPKKASCHPSSHPKWKYEWTLILVYTLYIWKRLVSAP